MVKRIAALFVIFAGTTVAWMILGSTIFARTFSLDSGLRERVASNWGSPQVQEPPTATYLVEKVTSEEAIEDDRHVTRKVKSTYKVVLPLQSSKIDVGFDLEHRQKGLLWYSTYKVGFSGDYTFVNTSDTSQSVTLRLKFPAAQAIYDDLVIAVDGQPLFLTNDSKDHGSEATASFPMAPNQTVAIHTGYRSQGLDSWRYSFGDNVAQVRDFSLHMRTNFKDIDFPDKTLSPTTKREIDNGWDLNWTYKNLVSGFQIGMAMPEKLQPGPLAGQISYFAPVSLLFFFFIIYIITTIRDIDLHPMNYFFLATAFFAFHLLLAYLVDVISIHAAFVISSCVSIFLVVSYLRLVVGFRFAAVEAGISQFIYLVLFSYAFFFKGLTGLAITIGSILTLFVVMQLTGRIRWSAKFAAPTPAPARA